MEVLSDFAMPLDHQIISEMMDLPAADGVELHQLAHQLCALNRSEPDRMRVFMQGMMAFKAYLSPFVEMRRAHPGDDLLSLLASGEQEGVYTREQVLANASVMLIAGQETTANLIGNSLLAFMRHRDQWERFQQDLSPTSVTRAIDECLRYDAPQKSVQRIAVAAVGAAASRFNQVIGCGVLSLPPTGTPKPLRCLIRSTLSAIPTGTSPLALAPTIDLAARWPRWRARRHCKHWRRVFLM
jgi:cytochrome P450